MRSTINKSAYWDKKHQQWLAEEWIDKQNIFAEQAIHYFPKAGTILDLGAGQGQDTRYFVSKGFKVFSTDFSKDALQLSKEKALRRGVKNITYQIVDLSGLLPFPDNSFDAIYAHQSLHYFDTKTTQQLFDEIYRVLKPGGVFATLTNSTSDREFASGTKVEDELIQIEGQGRKRFFSIDSMRTFTQKFKILLLDDNGATYKDTAEGVFRLIRLVATK